jgi:undecaprenyl-phosphate 4-deoxy-4-formamido-L-arabinose transferase
MDDDLQHDPRYLPAMLEALEQGRDVVYGRFRSKQQSLWKNLGSWFNGKVAEWVIDKPPGVYLSPYKVIRGELAREISRYPGPIPYVDGLLLQATSNVASVDIEHRKRFAGTGNYGLARSIGVWLRLAFAFSVLPLRLVALLGVFFACLAMLLVVATVAYRLSRPEDFGENAVGWASLIVTQLFVAGIQMIFFGVIGEYVGGTYLTLARKPQAAIGAILNAELPEAVPDPHPRP